jgi:hypothetical protein
MAKNRKRGGKRGAVYYNRYRSTWSPEEREAALTPGTKQYSERQADFLKGVYGVESDDVNEGPEAVVDIEDDKADEELEVNDFSNMGYNVPVRKFRRKMSKEQHAKRIQKIAQNGIGERILIHNSLGIPGARSMDDELYDDGSDEKHFAKDVLEDYKSDLKSACNTDNDHDGDVDEDDITPGMRKMMKYM